MNPMDDFLKAQRAQQAALASTSLTTFGGAPDVYAELFRTQRQTQVAPTLAIQSPQQALKIMNNRLTELSLLEADETPRWIAEHPDNAALVSDEVPRIIDTEKSIQNILKANRGAAIKTWPGAISSMAKSTAQGLRAQENILSLERINARASLYTKASEMLRDTGTIDYSQLDLPGGHAGRSTQQQLAEFASMDPSARAEVIQGMAEEAMAREDVLEQVEIALQAYAAENATRMRGHVTDISQIRDTEDFVNWAMVSSGPAAATIALFAAAGYFTGGAGVVAAGTALESGLMTSEAIERYGANELTSDDIARHRLFGLVSGASEIVLGPVARTTGGGLRRAVLGEIRSNVAEEVIERTAKGYLRRIGRHFTANAVEEAVQEAFQEFMSEAAVAGEDLEINSELVWRMANAAAVGALSGGVFGGTIGVRYNMRMEQAARQLADAGQTVRTMEELDAVTKDLKLVERSSTKFREWAGRLGLDNMKIFYQAETINDYIKSGTRPAPEVLAQLGLTEADFQTALASGARVQVSAAGVVEAMRTGHDPDTIKNEASVTPTGFTPSQASNVDELRKEITEQIEREYKLGNLSPDREQIISEVTAQLQAAGAKPDVAEQSALVVAAGFETLAKAYGGKDASGRDLYERYGFRVQAPETDATAPVAPVSGAPEARSEPEILYQSPIANDRTFLQQRVDEGASIEELLDDPSMVTAVAEMMALPQTMTEEEASVLDNFRERTYVDDVSGDPLTFPDMMDRLEAVSAAYAKGEVRKERRADILLGPPAAGKSTLAETMAPETGSRIIDPDDAKKMIPGYENGIGAMAVHEESSAISKFAVSNAIAEGENFIWPKVGENPDKIRKAVEYLKSQGYTVNLVNMHVPKEEAFRRMIGRFVHTGRLIPPRYSFETVGDNPETLTYRQLREEGVADGYANFDGTVAYGEPFPAIEDTRRGADAGAISARPGSGTAAGDPGTDPGYATFFQGGAPLFENPVEIEGKVTVKGIGQAMTDDHMETYGRQFFPEDSEEDYNYVLDYARGELAAQLQQPNSGHGWYSRDVQLAVDNTAKVYPQIATPEGRAVWLTFAGIFSNGLDPSQAWEISAEAFEAWLATGEIPVNRADAARARGVDPVMTTYKDRSTKEKVTKEAGWGIRNPANEQQLTLFKTLVEQKGSVLAALDWMTNLQPREDINQLMFDSGMKTPRYKTKAEKAGPPEYGAMIFSEKLGRYTLGLHGVPLGSEDTTVDLWFTRTFRRWTGRLMEKPLGKEGVAAQPSPARNGIERKTIFRLVGDLQADYPDLTAGDVQAMLWFFEKRLWAAQGLRTDEGTNSAGARRLLTKRGVEFHEGDGSSTARAEDRTFNQSGATQVGRGIDGRDARVRGQSAAGGAEASEAGVDARPADGVATVEDFQKLNDPEELRAFLTKSGWGVVTPTTMLPDSDFYRTQRETNPEQYALSVERHEARVAESHVYFKSLLKNRGIPFIELEGMYQGEPDGVSYMILADEGTVIQFGKMFNQDSVLTKDGLIFTTRTAPDVAVTGELMVGDEAKAEDFYSVTPDGTAFSMGLDFEHTGPGVPVIPEGYITQPDRPQLPINTRGKVELHHWTGVEVDAVDPEFAGTGPLKGEEAGLALNTAFFGINPRDNLRAPGTGYVKEGGLGNNHYVAEVDPDQLYPWFEDPEGLVAERTTSEARIAIRDAGYLGYYTTDDGSGNAPLGNVAALFSAVPVERADVVLQQGADKGPRGQIALPTDLLNGEAVITLFKSADASTFMHESGHFFLELFKTLATDASAPSTMTDDFTKVNEWLGRAADDTSEFTTEQQEKWAEGFETYLMEGNAPSIALRRAFQRFKDWLTHLYRTYSGPENQLTPEIRDVMDRMLATEEEIQLAKAEEGVGPMFLEHPPGMSEQSYEAYRRLMIDVDDEAEQKLFRKVMASIEKRNTKAYAEGVAAATEMHLAKLAEKKAYQLITRLQDPDVGIRLNKAELLARYTDEDVADVLADFSRKKHGGSRNMYAADGAPLDMVAEMAGYSSPGHMLRVLRTTPNMQQAAEKAAKAEVDRKFPDLLEDGTMREEARAALQNTKKGQLLHMEERQIRATIEAQGGQTPAPMSMDLMRATARDMIQSMTVGQASKPELFLRAERKAGREAQQAFARVASAAQGSRLSTTAAQDLMAAHAAKRRQILNYLLYAEAKKVADMVGKLQRKARQLNRKDARKKIGDPYISQIDRLLEQYDFRKLGPKAVRQKHALAALIQQLEENGHADRIAIRESMIAKTKAQHFSTLTTRELTDLRDTLKNLEHLGREVITGLLGAQELTFGEIKLELLESIEMHMDNNPPPLLPREESKSRRWASQIMNTLSTADTLIAQMDGNTGELGAAWRALKAPISAAQARVHARQTAARKAVAELFEKHFGKDLSILGSKTEYIAELNHDFTKAELLSMALNTGNADNWSRMTTGDLALGAPEDVRAALENHLSKEDWMFVQDFWDYINSYWGDIVALEMKTTGVAPQKVEADPKVVPYAFVKGGYYPIRYDARLSANVSEYQIDDTLKMLQVGRMTKAQTRDGHTKERMDRQMNKALVYDLGVGMAHLNDVIVDLELREPVKQVWRLLNDKDVQETLRLKGADDARIWLKLWVGDVVNGDRWASGGFNTMLRHLRGGLSIAKMGFSLTTLIQQPLGLAQSMVVVGKQDMMRAIWKWKTNPMRYAEQVKELSPFMQERTETFQRDMMLIKGALDTSPVASKWNGFKRTMTTAAFWAIQKSQFHLVDVPTWMAVYDRELAKGTPAKDAALMADQFVARAQGSGLLSDRSGFERGTLAEDQRSNELARLATAFGSYMMAKMNVATQRVRGTDFTDPADMLSLFTDLILLYGVEAMGSIFLTGRWPDFEEEEKDPMWWLAGETLSAVASGFPVARDVASAIQGYGGGGAYGSVVEAPRDVWEGASTAVGVAIGVEDEERMRRALQSLAGGVGVLAQLPTIQLERAMTALFERDMTVRKDFNMLDLAFGRKD